MTRGKILRDTNAGTGLLTIEGKQYSFTLEQMWTSDVPPRPGMTVDVIFDTAGGLAEVSAVPESQLVLEGASAALADAKRHSGALADGIVRRFGAGTPIALAILMISWVFLPFLIIHVPYGVGENVSFWGLLRYVNAPSPAAVLGQDPRFLSSGIWGILAVLSLVAPLAGLVWKDRKAALAGGLPVLFIILVFAVLRASIPHLAQPARGNHGFGGNQGFEGIANSIVNEAVNEVWRSSAFGAGFYISALCALYLAATGMRRYFGRTTVRRLDCIAFFSCLFFCPTSEAQLIPPESGQITVRLIQGLDSATARPGQASAATVVKSTNSAVPVSSSAVVQLVADPSGGLAVHLFRIEVNGQVFRAASSGAALAGGLVGKLNNKLHAPGAPQDAVSGSRVYLPPGTDVQFTLTTPPVQVTQTTQTTQETTRRAPAQVSLSISPVAPTPQNRPAVTPTPAWQFRAMNDGGGEAVIPGVAESGGRRGPAMLAVQCKVNSPLSPGAYATLGYEIRMRRGLVAFPTSDLSCFGDGAGNDYARIQVGTQPEKHGDFCYGDELPPNPNQSVAMQIVPPDPKSPVMSPGNSLQIGLRLPDTKVDAMVARFQLPQDAWALRAMTKPCFDILDDNARREQDARVVLCPEVSGKTLQNVEVLVGPAMTKLEPDGDNDIGTAWILPKKSKARPVPPKTTLACYYGAGNKPAGEAHEVLEKKLLPIPATAAYCVFREDGHCSTAEGRN